MTECIVRASDHVINDWNGEENFDENNEYNLIHQNFFTDESIDF
jgi:hypothetical protein